MNLRRKFVRRLKFLFLSLNETFPNKNPSNNQSMKITKLFQIISANLVALLLTASGCATNGMNETNKSSASSPAPAAAATISDSEIRNVIERVAKHQIHAL